MLLDALHVPYLNGWMMLLHRQVCTYVLRGEHLVRRKKVGDVAQPWSQNVGWNMIFGLGPKLLIHLHGPYYSSTIIMKYDFF